LRFGKPVVKTTSEVVVYRLGSNGEDAHDRKQSHARDRIEDDDWPPHPCANSGKRRGERVAGMIEALVAADAAGKRPRPHDSQSDRGDRRPEKGCRRVGRRLRSSHENKGRHEGKEDRSAGHDKGGGDNDRPFGVANVGQRARRSLHDKARDGGNRHHEADLILRPMPLRQEIDREIGSKPLANISEEEV
jgi:hypothetical protein